MSLFQRVDLWLFGPDAIYFWSLYAACIAVLLIALRWVAGAHLFRDLCRDLRGAFLDGVSRGLWDCSTIFGLLTPWRWPGSASMVRGYVGRLPASERMEAERILSSYIAYCRSQRRMSGRLGAALDALRAR